MTETNFSAATLNHTFETILSFMLPFFLTGAAGNADAARDSLQELMNAYNASTPTELDLVGRIIGFSFAAMDNLRLSMATGLSDTKVLRYRSNAVTLTRASDRARDMLERSQARREQTGKIPRPSVVAPPKATANRDRSGSVPAPQSPLGTAPPANGGVSEFAMDLETMKRDARIMMAAFSKNGVQASTAMPAIPNAAAAINAAAHAAVTQVRRPRTN